IYTLKFISMKNLNYFVLFCVISLLSISCSKDDEDNNNSNFSQSSIEITIDNVKHKFYINNCDYDADLGIFTFGIFNHVNPFQATMTLDCFSFYDIQSNKTDFTESIYLVIDGKRYDNKSGKAELINKDTVKQTMVFDLNGIWSNGNTEKEVKGNFTVQYDLE
ncbi:MAG: hypothetical protein LUE90_07790, partial [Clostridiales bacterium]|nr:hypothetical protein [Clostridiales bacterium]